MACRVNQNALSAFVDGCGYKKTLRGLYCQLSERHELRRQDSNMRPPGYEPGELPTAPLRDVNIAIFSRNGKPYFRIAGAKVRVSSDTTKCFSEKVICLTLN